MPQFPISDQQGIVDGLNYVLSGPGSLGQNFQGYSSNTSTAISGDIVDQTTGEITSSLPITTAFLQPYLTDCQARIGVSGGTDRVVLSGQLNMGFTYTTTAPCYLQYTVAINRYVAQANRSTNYNDYLFFYEKTVASQTYDYNYLDTSSGGIGTVTIAGAALSKLNYPAPATGSLVLPVDFTLVGLNADAPGTGLNANLNFKVAYGAAGAYDNVNSAVTVAYPGELWQVGETITVPGTNFPGGATPANDMVLTVATVSAGSGPAITENTVFTNIIDEPPIGYYLYALEVQWYALTGSITIDSTDMQVRSISAQTVKQ